MKKTFTNNFIFKMIQESHLSSVTTKGIKEKSAARALVKAI